MRPPSAKELQAEVNRFNSMFPVGTPVALALDNGETKAVTVRSEAVVLGGHSAVAWFDGVGGCYATRCVRPLAR